MEEILAKLIRVYDSIEELNIVFRIMTGTGLYNGDYKDMGLLYEVVVALTHQDWQLDNPETEDICSALVHDVTIPAEMRAKYLLEPLRFGDWDKYE